MRLNNYDMYVYQQMNLKRKLPILISMRQIKIIHESDKFSRITEIRLNGKKLSTPTYFPAISSLGSKFPFQDLFYLLKYHKYPRVLVSAYDLYQLDSRKRKTVSSLMEDFHKNGFLFIDSGLFESSWKEDKTWNLNSYKSILSRVNFDIYTSYDIYGGNNKSVKELQRNTDKNILESSVFMDSRLFLAIFHETVPSRLIKMIKQFLEKYPNLCGAVAVAEREIGKSLQDKAETIIRLRRIIDNNDSRNLLHILGCGNPLSMLAYSYCGADTFDSLDWLKRVIDPSSYLTHDFSHLELLNCKCQICTESTHEKADYFEKVLLHNLLFFQNFAIQLQSLIRNDNLKAYLVNYIGEKIMKEINEI